MAPVLLLRKWHDLRPEREWRCFVRDHTLVRMPLLYSTPLPYLVPRIAPW